MKKVTLGVFCLALLTLLTAPLFAKNQSGTQAAPSPVQTKNQTQLQQTTVTPTGQTVKNQNQVQTRNAGEEEQLRITLQEEEGSTPPGQLRSAERKSEVAKAVQLLLSAADRSGGIGPQIREIARAQNEGQTKAEANLLQARRENKVAQLILGSNYQNLKEAKKELTQIEARVRKLQQIQTKLTNQGAQQQIQEAIQTLEVQKTALQEALRQEENSFSLFGWLLRFF